MKKKATQNQPKTKMSAEGVADLGDYKLLLTSELGRGTFGTVFEGYHKRTNTKVAVKKMEIKSSEHGAEGMKEIKLLHRMESHENIIRLEDFYYQVLFLMYMLQRR